MLMATSCAISLVTVVVTVDSWLTGAI